MKVKQQYKHNNQKHHRASNATTPISEAQHFLIPKSRSQHHKSKPPNRTSAIFPAAPINQNTSYISTRCNPLKNKSRSANRSIHLHPITHIRKKKMTDDSELCVALYTVWFIYTTALLYSYRGSRGDISLPRVTLHNLVDGRAIPFWFFALRLGIYSALRATEHTGALIALDKSTGCVWVFRSRRRIWPNFFFFFRGRVSSKYSLQGGCRGNWVLWYALDFSGWL